MIQFVFDAGSERATFIIAPALSLPLLALGLLLRPRTSDPVVQLTRTSNYQPWLV